MARPPESEKDHKELDVERWKELTDLLLPDLFVIAFLVALATVLGLHRARKWFEKRGREFDDDGWEFISVPIGCVVAFVWFTAVGVLPDLLSIASIDRRVTIPQPANRHPDTSPEDALFNELYRRLVDQFGDDLKNPFRPHALGYESPNLVELAWKLMHLGSVAFDTPKKMVLERSETVLVAVSPKLSPKELEGMLSKEVGRGVKGDAIKISSRMRAELIGPAFTVTSVMPADQAVRLEEPTRWKWVVTPMESGDQDLHVSLHAFLTISDGSERDIPIVLKTYERTIPIEVTYIQRARFFWREHWQWTIATVLIPTVAFIIGRFRNGGGPKPPRPRFSERFRRRRDLA